MALTLMDRAVHGNRAAMADIAGFLTDFADQAVVLPVCLCAVAGLIWAGWRRGAIGFGIAASAVLFGMLALKLLAAGCGHFFPWLRLTSPSGHTAAAAAVYGGAIALALRRRLGPFPAALAGGLPVALAIGATRLALGVHTPSEVVAGALVGMAGVAAMVVLSGPPPPGLRPRRAILAALLVIVVLHGVRLQAEQRIRWASVHLWPFSACAAKEPFAAGGGAA